MAEEENPYSPYNPQNPKHYSLKEALRRIVANEQPIKESEVREIAWKLNKGESDKYDTDYYEGEDFQDNWGSEAGFRIIVHNALKYLHAENEIQRTKENPDTVDHGGLPGNIWRME